MRWSAFIAGALMLAGCADCPPLPPPPPLAAIGEQPAIPCPVIDQRTKDEDRALADQLATLPEGSPVWTAVLEWQRLRDDARSCQRLNPK